VLCQQTQPLTVGQGARSWEALFRFDRGWTRRRVRFGVISLQAHSARLRTSLEDRPSTTTENPKNVCVPSFRPPEQRSQEDQHRISDDEVIPGSMRALHTACVAPQNSARGRLDLYSDLEAQPEHSGVQQSLTQESESRPPDRRAGSPSGVESGPDPNMEWRRRRPARSRQP